MRYLKTMVAIGSTAALAVAVPAIAKPSHPTTSHKCAPHRVAYTAHGILTGTGWSLTENMTNGNWSGSVTVVLQGANHHVTKANGLTLRKGARGATDAMFTVTADPKVVFGKGVTNPPAPGSRVYFTGSLAQTNGHGCTASSTITIKRIKILAPKHS